MVMQRKVPKTVQQKIADLDDHLYLLRQHLNLLKDDEAHLKAISAELRVLVCFSSGTEGLLWRLVDELGVSDALYLHVAGNVNKNHPLAKGLNFVFVPIERGGQGDPALQPAYYSFRSIIKECEAVFVSGKGITHEYLIKAIAQQMGSAHEDDGLEPSLVDLGNIFLNGIQPYVPILAKDAEFILEIGERILQKAEKVLNFKKKERS
jgi:hypothetical protein